MFTKHKGVMFYVGAGTLFLLIVIVLIITSIVNPMLFEQILEALDRIISVFSSK